MTTPYLSTYRRTQKGPWWLLMFAMAAVFLTVSWCVQGVLALGITFLITGIFMFLLGMSLRYLTVEDEGDRLAIRFGPLPVFVKRIFYDDILEVEKGRTTLLDGWGIHLSLRGGWVWNIWGFDCVVLRLNRGILRVGTDDPDGLIEFLKARTGQGAAHGKT
jgi:hypothetical protein